VGVSALVSRKAAVADLKGVKSGSGILIWNESGVSGRKNPTLGEKFMGKSIFWLITILLVFQDSGSIGAQNQAEGKKLYATYCSSCHGDNGKGDGPASQAFPVKPGDHTNGTIVNNVSDKFLFEIISKGGGTVGKSTFMPAWGNQLGEKQINDLIAYIRSIADPPYKAPAK